MTEATRLNSAAYALATVRSAEPARGSLGWVTARYCASEAYRDLAPGTVKYYRRYLRDIEALGPALPFSAFTRQAVVDFLEIYRARHQRRHPQRCSRRCSESRATMASLKTTSPVG